MSFFLSRIPVGLAAIVFGFLLQVSSLCPAAPTLPELEKRATELRTQLDKLERDIQGLRGTTATAAKAVPAATGSRTAANPGPARQDQPSSSRNGSEASNRFLEWLIVLAFLVASASFIAGRYRDSKSGKGTEEAAANGQSTTASPASSSVVFYTREIQETGDVAPPPEEVTAETNSPAEETEPAPEVEKPDLLVEPKKSSRSRKNS